MLGETAQGGRHLVYQATGPYDVYTKFHFSVFIFLYA